jgi:PAS domain S-box-containing protein
MSDALEKKMAIPDYPDIEKQRFLESMFETIQEGIIFLDRNLTIVRANPWVQLRYASKMPVNGKKCFAVFQDKQNPCADCPFVKTIESGRQHSQIVRYPSDRDSVEWFEMTVQVVENGGGQVIGAIGHVTDVTEHRKADELLRDEVAWRRLLVEHSRDGIVVLDQTGKVYEANHHYAHMLGYSMEEVHQLYVWDWDSQWTREALLEMIRTVDDSGDHFETRHRRKDGTLLDVEISTNGTVYRGQKLVFCVCRDITERKKAETEREALISELQDALKEIRTLRGILPLCSFCKKVRNDAGYWEQVDVYIYKHSLADISHSICPDCMKKHYPEMDI